MARQLCTTVYWGIITGWEGEPWSWVEREGNLGHSAKRPGREAFGLQDGLRGQHALIGASIAQHAIAGRGPNPCGVDHQRRQPVVAHRPVCLQQHIIPAARDTRTLARAA